MVTWHRRRSRGCQTVGALTRLLVGALFGPGHGLERPAPAAGEGRPGGPAARLHLTVHQGRLSVDLWDAEVAKVLTQIGQEAGVLIIGSPTSGAQVSVQFTDLPLEVGLRRLLWRAALSYAIRYARDPAGGASIQEVRVFKAVDERSPFPLNATTRTGPDRTVRRRANPQPPAD